MAQKRTHSGPNGLASGALTALLGVSLACATPTPPASGGLEGDPNDPVADTAVLMDPNSPEAQAQIGGPNGQPGRAETAMEGVIMGTVIGGQVGGNYGAAAGALLFGLYGLITGDVPFDTGRGQTARRRTGGMDPDTALDREIEEELSKQDDLESEIEEELRRQEELLAAIEKQEDINESIVEDQKQRARRDHPDDPLAAPESPHERELPESIFDRQDREENGEPVVVKTLDADRDGRSEVEVVYDNRTGERVRRDEDTNYDGVLDVSNRYENGQVKERSEDTNHDGKPDRWVEYENGRGKQVKSDRNFDGVADATYVYEGGALAREEPDTHYDGRVDRQVVYKGRKRAFEVEDRDGNGSLESRTFFDDKERPIRTERDLNGDGKPDVWEHYDTKIKNKLVLARKEEDTNHDGAIDVTSHYKKGKLVRREVAD